MKNRIVWTSALLASTLGMLVTGCKSNLPQPGEAPIVDGTMAASDPAAVNLASPGTQVAGSAFAATQQVSTQSYPQQAAPAAPNYGVGNSQQNEAYRYNTQAPANQGDPNAQYSGDPQANAAEYDQYSQLLDPNVPPADQAPPPLPSDYEQPEAPGPDYLWTPGYWDYATPGYYYVPGVWVGAPYAGALWTPGWWGFISGHYRWHHGYWGQHVGYYGGINYGFGYVGYGYQGGYWNNNHFWYNSSVLRVNPRFVNNNVYQRNVTVVNREYVNNSRVSYVGGIGGLRRGPAPQEMAALREPRTMPMQSQMENRREAQGNRQQFFEANKGRPQTLVAARPLAPDHNVQAPNRMTPSPLATGHPGVDGRPGVENHPGVNVPRDQQMQGALQRDQRDQQHNQPAQLQNQQHDVERGGFNEQQRNQQAQQALQRDQQHNQQLQNQQRDQIQNQQREQLQNQQRDQQMNVQRQQDQLRTQQMNEQRQQQVNTQHQLPPQQTVRPAPTAPMHMDAPHPPPPAPHVEAPRPMPTTHVETARPAPPPAMHSAPPPAPHSAPAGGGGGGNHH
jgi:hypothetical protein